MKNPLFQASFLVLALAAATAFAAEPATTSPSFMALETPAPLELLPPGECRYRCMGNFTTSPGGGQPSHWGMDSDCNVANTILLNELSAAADAGCWALGHDGACVVTPVITTTCTNSNHQADGYANYKCSFEICF